MSVRICFLPFICILLLGLTSRAFAVTCSFDGAPSPWVSKPHYYQSQAEAAQACQEFGSSNGKSCQGPVSCANSDTGSCSWRAGYIEYWVDGVGATNIQNQFMYCAADPACPDERAALEQQCGGPDKYTIDEVTCQGQCIDTCADERAAAESECGGADLYVIDEQTCEWHCDDSQDCLDSDDDGAADVCDPCPDNPDISEDSVQIYRLNGDSMSEKCGESTMSCDGTVNFEGNTGTICQAAEVKVTECRAVRGSGAVCKADKDTDGDGIPDSIDPDDDNDGIPDGQDPCPRNEDPNCEDSDGDGIPDSEDPDDDGDGTPDSEDEDDDGDGVPDEQDMPVDWGDYGQEPADLPELDFGKVEPAEDSNSLQSKVKSGLNNLFPVFSGSSCSSVISLPVPSLGGLQLDKYSLDLCYLLWAQLLFFSQLFMNSTNFLNPWILF